MASMGICEFGFHFYNCDNGFKGCCRVDACGRDQCPEGSRTTTSYPVPFIDSSTAAPPVDTDTDLPSVSTIFTNTDNDGNDDGPGDSTTFVDPSIPTTTTDTETTSSSSSSASSPSSSLASSSQPSPPPPPPTPPTPPTVTVPINTSTPQPINIISGEPSRLSTTALAGICVGGTAVAAFMLLIVCLLIRRRCIARRMAAIPAAAPFADEPRFAEGFMSDHPMWCERRDEDGPPADPTEPEEAKDTREPERVDELI
ncbi:hypothetical protein F4781DRAFT_445215 [Annulohypoxylon bovei var. microspora]|nr:hypothetical protein F4781DRAFT_445215 [Annulohypoxylon bovei var. microspora]